MTNNQLWGRRVLVAGFVALMLAPWPLWLLLRGPLALDSANHENRTPAAFPALAATDVSLPDQLESWPSDFELWLNDHAPFRNQLMTLNAGVNNCFFTLDSQDVLRGKDGWLFLKDVSDSTSLSDYQGITAFSDAELAEYAATLDALQTALAAHGSSLAVVIAPAKEGVYSSLMPETAPVVSRPTRVQALADYLQKNSTVPVVWPQQALIETSATAQVYYRYDTHWNDVGAWVTAQQALPALGKPAATVLPPVVADPSRPPLTDLANMCASWAFCTNDVYLEVDAPRAQQISSAENGTITRYAGSGTGNLLLARDSFGEMLAPHLALPFANTLALHGNVLNAQTLAAEQPEFPQAVVLEIGERMPQTLLARAQTLLDWANRNA